MPNLILIIHIVISFFLSVVILMQSSRENELSGLFSGGGEQSLFGPRSGNILTRITTVLAVIFMTTSLALTIISARRPRRIIDRVLTETGREQTDAIPQGAIPLPSLPTDSEAAMPSEQ